KACGGNRVAERVRGAAEGDRCLVEIVLQKPRLGARGTDGEVGFAGEPGRAERGRQELRGFGSASPFERSAGARQKCLQGRRGHCGEYNARGLETGWRPG